MTGRAPLKEALGVRPNHLVKQMAAFVGIVVFRNDPASLAGILFGPEAATDKSLDYGALLATRMAVNQNLSVVGIPDA